MKFSLIKWCSVTALILIVTTHVWAESIIFSLTASNGKIIFCSQNMSNNEVEAGQLVGFKFVSYSTRIEQITKSIRKAKKIKSTKQSIRKLNRKKIAILNSIESETLLCRQSLEENPDDSQDPTPTPTATGTPPPIEEDNPYFDQFGNTKPGAFNIPLGKSGNISKGRTTQLINCLGCHPERVGRDFNQVNEAIHTVPDMQGVLSGYSDLDQAMADLVAYFNRFATN